MNRTRLRILAAVLVALIVALWSRSRPAALAEPPGGDLLSPVVGPAAAGPNAGESLQDPGDPEYASRLALVVGINRYDHHGQVLFAVNDAASLAAVLADRFRFDVTLLIDEWPEVPLPTAGVTIVTVPKITDTLPKITDAVLLDQLRVIGERVTKYRDGFVFFYSGHGRQIGPKGYIIPGNGLTGGATDNLVDFATVATELRRPRAHHTLMILNCCHSRAALDPASGVADAVKGLDRDDEFRWPGDTNLRRMFEWPAFLVMTATTAKEPAQAESNFAEQSAHLSVALPAFQGRSPFTATMLQGLQGLAGLPDGTLLGSQLALYINTTLVGDKRLRVSQKPQFQRLGERGGDFLFFPRQPVLSPKLVGPLYLPDGQFDELQVSACAAIAAEVRTGKTLSDRLQLAREAIPHLVSVLYRGRRGRTAEAAAAALADSAEAVPYNHRAELTALQSAAEPLTQRVADRRASRALRFQAARALGGMAPLGPDVGVAALPALATLFRDAVLWHTDERSAESQGGVYVVGNALVWFGPAAVPHLAAHLKDPAPAVVMWAAYELAELARLGADAAPAVPDLRAALSRLAPVAAPGAQGSRPDEQSRTAFRYVVDALGAVGPKAEAAVPDLVRVLATARIPEERPTPGSDPPGWFGHDATRAAARALAAIGPAAVPPLRKLVADRTGLKCWAGATALAQLGEAAGPAVPDLLDVFTYYGSAETDSHQFGPIGPYFPYDPITGKNYRVAPPPLDPRYSYDGINPWNRDRVFNDVAWAVIAAGPMALPVLEERLAKVNGVPRRWIVFILAVLQNRTGRPLPALAALRDDPDPTVRGLLVTAATRAHHVDGAATAAALLAASRDPDIGVREAVVTAVARMRFTGRVRDALADALRDPYPPNVDAAMEAVAQAGERAASLRSVLELIVLQPAAQQMYGWKPQAAAALFRVGGGGPEVSVRLARDGEWNALVDLPAGPGSTAVMLYALAESGRVLGAVDVVRKYGGGSDGSVPVLTTQLRDTGDYHYYGRQLHLAAPVTALGAVGGRGNPSVAADLIRVLEEPDEVVWAAAVNALVAVGPRAVPALTAALTSPDKSTLTLPPQPPVGPPRGRNGRWDPVAERQFGAGAALARLAPAPTIVPVLAAGLTDPSPEKRYAAATALAATARHPAAAAAVTAALAEALKDSRRETVLAAAAAVAAAGPPVRGAVPQLIDALAYPTPDVREAAADALAAVGLDATDAPAALRALLADRAPAVRLAAALAIAPRPDRRDTAAERVLLDELARMDAPAHPARPFTENSLAAVSAVADLAPVSDRAVLALVAVLKSGGYLAHRAAAAEGLVRVGRPALPAVVDAWSAVDWQPVRPPGVPELLSFLPWDPPPGGWQYQDNVEDLSFEERMAETSGGRRSRVYYDDLPAAYPATWVRSTPFGEVFDAVGGVPEHSPADSAFLRRWGAGKSRDVSVQQADARLAAAAVAGRIAAADPAALPLIAAGLRRPAPGPWFALAALGRAGPAAAPILRDAARAGGPDDRRAAVRELARLGPPAVEALVAVLDAGDPAVVAAAADGLGVIGPDGKAAVRPLARLLNAKDPDVRFAGAWALGNIGPAAGGASGELIRGLRDGSPDVRRAAAEALGLVPVQTPEVADALTALIADPDPRVRVASVGSLGKVGPGLPEPMRARIVKILIGVLGNSDSTLRYRAADALGRFRDEAAPAVPDLVKLLQTNDRVLVPVVLDTLAEIGPKAEAAVPLLVAMISEAYGESRLPEEPYLCRLRAVTALARIGPAAIPPTMKALEASRGERRFLLLVPELMGGPAHEAVRSLAAIVKQTEGDHRPPIPGAYDYPGEGGPYDYSGGYGRGSTNLPAAGQPPGNSVSTPAEIECDIKYDPGPIWSSILSARIEAIRALAAIGPAAADAVPDLSAALTDPGQTIRREAAVALGRIGRRAEPAVPALVAALRPPDTKDAYDPGQLAYARALPFVLDALGRVGPGAVAPLIEALRNPDPKIRFWAAKALGPNPFDREAVVRGLATALGDQEWAVRAQAAESLGKQGPAATDKVPELVAALVDGNWEVASAARLALVAVGDPAVPSLAETLKNAPLRGRVHAAAALLELGREEPLARAVVAKCLQDDNDELRAAAAGVLGELGVKAVPLIGELEAVRTKDAQMWVRSVADKSYDTVRLFVP